MVRIFIFCLLATLAALIAGCGKSAEGGERAPTRAAFIKRADAICDKADEKQNVVNDAYLDKHRNVSQPIEENVVRLSLPLVQIEAEEIAALPAPEGDEEKIGTIIQGIERAVERGEANPSTLLTRSAGPFVSVDKLAREYGFKACALPL
jgi:hypothetical protein